MLNWWILKSRIEKTLSISWLVFSFEFGSFLLLSFKLFLTSLIRDITFLWIENLRSSLQKLRRSEKSYRRRTLSNAQSQESFFAASRSWTIRTVIVDVGLGFWWTSCMCLMFNIGTFDRWLFIMNWWVHCLTLCHLWLFMILDGRWLFCLSSLVNAQFASLWRFQVK